MEEGQMKRIFGLLVRVGFLMVPTVSFAEGDQIGIYVAPKFVYGLTQFQHPKEIGQDSWDNYETNTEGVSSKIDSIFGGSIAIGYDFDKKFGVPIRTEIEYSAFSQAKIKYDSFYDPGVEEGRSTHKYQIQTLFLNAYYDFNTRTKFTPYLGVGIGLAFINYKYHTQYYPLGNNTPDDVPQDPSLSKQNTNFAWNVGMGLG
jgi:opacity protein-like surface antigen